MTPDELSAMMQKVGLHKVEYRKMGLGTVAIHAGEKPGGETDRLGEEGREEFDL